MSRYRSGSTIWPRYADITVDNIAGAAGSENVLAVIPKDFDDFWLNVQSDASDVRVLDPDGFTLETYDVKDAAGTGTFSKTNRDGCVRVTFTAPVAGMCRLVLAWGVSGVSSAAGVPGTSSQRTGYIATDRPQVVVNAGRPRPGATKPDVRIQKGSTEEIRVGFRVGGLLDRRNRRYAGGYEGDAIASASYSVLDAGSAQAAMITASSVRFHWPDTMSVVVKAGSSGSNYIISPTITTKNTQVLNPRAKLDVYDLAE